MAVLNIMSVIRKVKKMSRKQWERHFDWCIYHSKTFDPIRQAINIIGTVLLFLFKALLKICLIIMLPITIIEFKVRTIEAKKRMESKKCGR